jgi:hypothetical protein
MFVMLPNLRPALLRVNCQPTFAPVAIHDSVPGHGLGFKLAWDGDSYPAHALTAEKADAHDGISGWHQLRTVSSPCHVPALVHHHTVRELAFSKKPNLAGKHGSYNRDSRSS